jgi:hypothetical protein
MDEVLAGNAGNIGRLNSSKAAQQMIENTVRVVGNLVARPRLNGPSSFAEITF